MTESRYFRYPNLRGDLLTFVADDDVWLAPAAGGRAWRISADRAQAAGPKFSGDGSQVAWTSWRDGPPEIYLASTDGGDTARVSYWSNQSTRLRGWNPEGEILATDIRVAIWSFRYDPSGSVRGNLPATVSGGCPCPGSSFLSNPAWYLAPIG